MLQHDARNDEHASFLARCQWRVGGSLGRTVYAMLTDGPPSEHARDDQSVLIGVFDSALLAAAAVESHNTLLDKRLR